VSTEQFLSIVLREVRWWVTFWGSHIGCLSAFTYSMLQLCSRKCFVRTTRSTSRCRRRRRSACGGARDDVVSSAPASARKSCRPDPSAAPNTGSACDGDCTDAPAVGRIVRHGTDYHSDSQVPSCAATGARGLDAFRRPTTSRRPTLLAIRTAHALVRSVRGRDVACGLRHRRRR